MTLQKAVFPLMDRGIPSIPPPGSSAFPILDDRAKRLKLAPATAAAAGVIGAVGRLAHTPEQEAAEHHKAVQRKLVFYSDKGDVESIMQLIAREAGGGPGGDPVRFNTVNACTCLHRLSHSPPEARALMLGDPRFRFFIEQILRVLLHDTATVWTPGDYAAVVTAVARFGRKEENPIAAPIFSILIARQARRFTASF